jgi:hypothetical protein
MSQIFKKMFVEYGHAITAVFGATAAVAGRFIEWKVVLYFTIVCDVVKSFLSTTAGVTAVIMNLQTNQALLLKDIQRMEEITKKDMQCMEENRQKDMQRIEEIRQKDMQSIEEIIQQGIQRIEKIRQKDMQSIRHQDMQSIRQEDMQSIEKTKPKDMQSFEEIRQKNKKDIELAFEQLRAELAGKVDMLAHYADFMKQREALSSSKKPKADGE